MTHFNHLICRQTLFKVSFAPLCKPAECFQVCLPTSHTDSAVPTFENSTARDMLKREAISPPEAGVGHDRHTEGMYAPSRQTYALFPWNECLTGHSMVCNRPCWAVANVSYTVHRARKCVAVHRACEGLQHVPRNLNRRIKGYLEPWIGCSKISEASDVEAMAATGLHPSAGLKSWWKLS